MKRNPIFLLLLLFSMITIQACEPEANDDDSAIADDDDDSAIADDDDDSAIVDDDDDSAIVDDDDSGSE